MSWEPPLTLEEQVRAWIVPPRWHIRYETARALRRGERELAFLPFLEVLSGLAAIGVGDVESAISHFEAARARAPQSRAPLRHLLFLYLKTGQTDKALKILADLRRVEPDFSFSRIKDDPAYPAGTLRSTGLVNLSITE